MLCCEKKGVYENLKMNVNDDHFCRKQCRSIGVIY